MATTHRALLAVALVLVIPAATAPMQAPAPTALARTAAGALRTLSGVSETPTTPPPTGTATPTTTATSTATGVPTMTVTGTVSGISGLHVQGNQILNGSGQPVRLLGVDRSGSEYACIQGWGFFDGPADAASVAAIASWHTNAVRVPLNEDCWLGINGAPAAYSGASYQQAIASYVNLLNSNGLVAILDLHWTAPGGQLATGQQPMPDQDHAVSFWQSVATAFKDNSSVIFDLFNEPYPDSNQDTTAGWRCWRDGSTATPTTSTPIPTATASATITATPMTACPGVAFPVAGMQELVTTIRATGANNIIMLGGLEYSNALSQWLTYQPTDPAHNLVASWHSYNFNPCNTQPCWDQTVAPVAAQVPVVAGEIGENDCADGYINPLMAWLDSHGMSYLGWAWNTAGCAGFPALISDYAGTPTNFGQGFHDHLFYLATGQQVPTATPPPPVTTTFPYAIRVGSTQPYTASDGTVYTADPGVSRYSGALSPYSSTDSLGGNQDAALFDTGERGQDYTYNVDIPNGTYNVALQIGNPSGANMGPNGDDIYIQSNKVAYCYVITSVDDCTASPTVGTAGAYTSTATVTNGILSINIEGSYGNAGGLLSGIKITQSGQGTSTTTAVATSTATNTSVSTATPTATASPSPVGTPPSDQWLNPLITAYRSDGGDGAVFLNDSVPMDVGYPSWVAFDLSAVPAAERQSIRLYYNAQAQNGEYDASVNGYTYYTGVPGSFQVQVNPATQGGTPPTNGWTTVVSATANALSQLTFILPATQWVRFVATAASPFEDLMYHNYLGGNFDFYNGAAPTASGAFFVGDSITLLSAGHNLGADTHNSYWSYAIQSALGGDNLPTMINDGVGGTTAADLCSGGALTSRFRRDLDAAEGQYVVIGMGMNDANPSSFDPSGYLFNMRCAVNAVLARGMTPVVPTISWTSVSGYSADEVTLNDEVRSLIWTIPGVMAGPDFYTYFQQRPYLLRDPSPSSTDVHPNTQGMQAIELLWENWFLQNIYGVGFAHLYPDPNVPVTPTATDTPTATATPSNTATATPHAGLAITSPIGVPFQTIALIGANFGPIKQVALYWGRLGTTPLFTTTTTVRGFFMAKIHIPPASTGPHLLIARSGTSGIVAAATLHVMPRLIVVPSAGPVGTHITIRGFGFGAGEWVAAYWDKPLQGLGLGLTNGVGSFYTPITTRIPASNAGLHVMYGLGLRTHAVGASILMVRASSIAH